MKKSITKLLDSSLKKLKLNKKLTNSFKFSDYKEDFVITEQEEREGGFFGSRTYKIKTT